MGWSRLKHSWLWPAVLLAAAAVQAQEAEQQQLPAVVVTATRSAVPVFDVPASISLVDSNAIHDGHALINLSDSLGAVPGLVARDRQNYAQDVQLSIRGFGARSSFGIQGLRLYVDGIPATMPDGQGQITNVDLSTASRIEVLRGPFSALYGNSAGGVIQVFTAEGRGPPTMSFNAVSGGYGETRLGVQLGGSNGRFSYQLSASQFNTDGYREHSAAQRDLGNGKFVYRPDDDSKVTVIFNSIDVPKAQDPMGLTRAEYLANPRGVDPSALLYNTRKTVEQTQAGLTYERRVNADNVLQLMVYDGHRGTEQFQSIPAASESGPTNPGGVIALQNNYGGLDLRWTTKTQALGSPLTLVGGVAYDDLISRRQGYLNFVGTALGVLGALRRDEVDSVVDLDPYAQASWQPTPKLQIDAGVRSSHVSFRDADQYITPTNPDSSGSVRYGATLPAVGLMYALSQQVHLYATAGRGFETPTLNYLAYRPNGAPGLNFGLQPATSTSVEMGVKTQTPFWGEWTAALFNTDTQHEIVVQTSTNGRSVYQNAGGTHRTGVELSWAKSFADAWQAQLATTVLNATYSDGFLTCTASPCATPNVPVAAGNRIPGIPRSNVFVALHWAPSQGWRGGVEWRAWSSVVANDINSGAAAGYTAAAADVGYLWHSGSWQWSGFVRSDNLLNHRYIGSVIVNDTNSRFFEPAPGRTWLASLTATLRFR